MDIFKYIDIFYNRRASLYPPSPSAITIHGNIKD